VDRSKVLSYNNFGHSTENFFGKILAITVDNGTQFDVETFKTFCDQIGTKIHFASVRHPESNGLVERANRIIITGIMKSIFNHLKESGRMN
jgi:IS30 family transposase